MVTRRRLIRMAGAGVLALPFASITTGAHTYPAHPVRIIAGFPKGGPVDIAARVISPWLSDRFGQPFAVENMPGESGNIATGEVVKAPPDGYTLFTVRATEDDQPRFSRVYPLISHMTLHRLPAFPAYLLL